MKEKTAKRRFRPVVVFIAIIIILYSGFLYVKYTNTETYNFIYYYLNPKAKIFDTMIASKLNKQLLQLTSKDFSSIDTLYLSDSKMTDIRPIKKLKNLKTLSVMGLKIKNIEPLSKLKNLENLTLQALEIGSLEPLSNLKKLRELYLFSVGIRIKPPSRIEWRIREFLRLPEKYEGRKPISIAALKNLENLEKLSFESTRLNSIKVLSGLKKLETLELSGTLITDIKPLSKLKNLKHLYITEKKVKSIKPLKALVNLENLSIRANNISDEQRAELIEALPNTRITK